jgi:argininosuccinate lyase
MLPHGRGQIKLKDLVSVMQPAQAVRWSHWLLGHAASWQRDDMRLHDLLPRVATLPLGSGEFCKNVRLKCEKPEKSSLLC